MSGESGGRRGLRAGRATPAPAAPPAASPGPAALHPPDAGAARIADEGPHPPLPPDDLAGRTVPVLEVPARVLYRVHWPGRALHFGPLSGQLPRGRFDAPGGEYRVHYSALTFAGAFVEALLRQEQPTIVTRADLAARALSAIRLARPLRVIPLYGRHLRPLGATAAVASGPYRASRRWGSALWAWRPAGTTPAAREGVDREGVDGIVYPSRHDDREYCLALFDRAASAVAVERTAALEALLPAVLRLRRHYRFPLDLDEGA